MMQPRDSIPLCKTEVVVSTPFEEGAYRVAAFARAWREEYRRQQQMSRKDTFVPLSFAAGEAFQFNWNENCADHRGRAGKLQVAHFKLSYSRAGQWHRKDPQ